MMAIEKMSFSDALWLTLTTATTVGYGDLSAKTDLGRYSTIILMYLAGIFITAQAAALYFEYMQEKRFKILRGEWSWKMKNHIVFLNCPAQNSEKYFLKAIKQLRASCLLQAQKNIIIVTPHIEFLSDELRNLNVFHICKSAYDMNALEKANILFAETIIILTHNDHDDHSDGMNFDLVHRLRDIGVNGRIIVEASKDENRKRMLKIGANSVLRPIRSYPEMMARAILTPSSELVIETLFNSYGEECVRFDISNTKMYWKDIVKKIVSNDIGTPIGYESLNEQIIVNPLGSQMIEAKALYVIIDHNNLSSQYKIEKALAA
jgi:voltage-gated potassium channel